MLVSKDELTMVGKEIIELYNALLAWRINYFNLLTKTNVVSRRHETFIFDSMKRGHSTVLEEYINS